MDDEAPQRLPGVNALDALAAAAAAHAPQKRARSNIGLNAVAEAAAAAAAADGGRTDGRLMPPALSMESARITYGPSHQHATTLAALSMEPAERLLSASSHRQHAATLASISEWAPPAPTSLPPMQAPHGMAYNSHQRLPWTQSPTYSRQPVEQPLPHIPGTDEIPRASAPGSHSLSHLSWQQPSSFGAPKAAPQLSSHHHAADSEQLPGIRRPLGMLRNGSKLNEDDDARQRLSSSSQLSQEPLKPLTIAEPDVTAYEHMDSSPRASNRGVESDEKVEFRPRDRGLCPPLPPMLVSRSAPESALLAVANAAAAEGPLPPSNGLSIGLLSAPLDALADAAMHAQLANSQSHSVEQNGEQMSGQSEAPQTLPPLRLPSLNSFAVAVPSIAKQPVSAAEAPRIDSEALPPLVEPKNELLPEKVESGKREDETRQLLEKEDTKKLPRKPKAVVADANPSKSDGDGEKKEEQKDEQKHLEDDEETGGDGDEITRCPCGSTENSQYMVACDECKTWQHFKCMGLRRRGDVAPDKKYYCHICRPDEMRPNCIAHPRYKERNQNRDRDRSKDLDPALSGVKPLELRRLFSADLKVQKFNPQGFSHEELFRRYAGLFRSQFGKDKQSVIEGLMVVTVLSRVDVQARLESVLRKMRGGGSRNSCGLGVDTPTNAASTAEPARVSAMDVSPTSRNSTQPGQRVSSVSPQEDNGDADCGVSGGIEATSPRKPVATMAVDGTGDLHNKGKRLGAKAGSKRPRSNSVVKVGAGEDIQPVIGGDAAGGDADNVGANGRSMSTREARKISQYMRMFQKMEDEGRGKKKPRTAGAHDSPKNPNGDNSGSQALPSESVVKDIGVSSNSAEICQTVKLTTDKVGDGDKREESGPNPISCAPPIEQKASQTSGDVAVTVDREPSRKPGDVSVASKAPEGRENFVSEAGPSRDKKRAQDRERIGGDHRKNGKTAEALKDRGVAVSSRDRKGRRVSDPAITRRSGPSALVSARRNSGESRPISSGGRTSEEREPIDPVLLIQITVPGPSVLRSQLVPAARRSTLENEFAEAEAFAKSLRVPPRRLKKEWLYLSSLDAERSLAGKEAAFPAKKRWAKAEGVGPVVDDSECDTDLNGKSSEPMSVCTVAKSPVKSNRPDAEKLSVSMVVVSERDALPDLGKKLEVSLVHGSGNITERSKSTSKETKGVVAGALDRGQYEDAIRCVIVKSRSGAKAKCLKKRAAMFFGDDPVRANGQRANGQHPGSPVAKTLLLPRQAKASSPILNLRSAPLPPRSPQSPISNAAAKSLASPRSGGGHASRELRAKNSGSPVAGMASPLLKKRCTALMNFSDIGSNLADTGAGGGADDCKEEKTVHRPKAVRPVSSPAPDASSSPLRSPGARPSSFIPLGSPRAGSDHKPEMMKASSPRDGASAGPRIPRVFIPRSSPAATVQKCAAAKSAPPRTDAKSDTSVGNNWASGTPRPRGSPLPSPTGACKGGGGGLRAMTSTPPPPPSAPPALPAGSPPWRPAYRFGGGGRGKPHTNGASRAVSYPSAKNAAAFGSLRAASASPVPSAGRLPAEGGADGGGGAFSKGAAPKGAAAGDGAPPASAAAALSAWSSFRQQNGWSQHRGANGDGGAGTGAGGSSVGSDGGGGAGGKRRQRG